MTELVNVRISVRPQDSETAEKLFRDYLEARKKLMDFLGSEQLVPVINDEKAASGN